MTSLRRISLCLVLAGPLLMASHANATVSHGCWNFSTYGVGLTESFAAGKASWLMSVKASVWSGKSKSVSRPWMKCGKDLFVYHCTSTARFCK